MRSVAELQLAPPNFVRHPGDEHVTSGTTEIDKTSGAVTCAQAADMSRCSFSDFQVVPDVFLGNYTIKLKVKGAASDPCVNLAADIDYEGDISVFCSPRGNLVEVSFDGKIDAFPAFEMYARLNGVTAVLFKKPPPPGNTVTNLVFGANTPVSGRVRFEGCFLGQADRSTQEGAENASEGIDPVGLLVGVTLASQLARPMPNQQAQPAPSLPDFGAPPGGGDATQRELADAEATREAPPVDAMAVEASRPNEYVDAESELAVVEAMPATMPAAAPEAMPAAIPEALPEAMTVDADFAYEDVPPVQILDPITPIHRIAAPATIYDAVISGRGAALLRRLGACCQLVAGPGEPLPTALLPGDVIVRRALGEAGVGHMFTVVDGTLLRSDELLRLLLRQERPSDGWLVQVIEPARGRAAVDDLCRVALNAYRRVPFDQLVLRPFPPEQADSDAEGSPEGGGADIPCAADISPFGLTWRETDLKNRRNPRPQRIRGKLMCPGKADPPERSGPGGQTIKLLLWNFDIDGSYPKRQHETALDQLVVALHQALRTPVMAPAPASYTLHLSGFASQTGSVEHNTALATDRERAVERYLRDHIEDAGGIPETPIAPQVKFEFKSAGFDPEFPRAPSRHRLDLYSSRPCPSVRHGRHRNASPRATPRDGCRSSRRRPAHREASPRAMVCWG